MANSFATSGSDPNLNSVAAQEWETKLQERLNKPISFKEICKVIYSSTYAVNAPYMSTSFSAQTGTRGTAYSFSDFTITNDQLIISSQKIVPVYVDRADLAQCNLVNQMEIAERQGNLINEALETAVLAGYAGWTDFGTLSIGGGGAATTAITVSINNIDNIIRGIKREIAENNAQSLADRNGIFIVWRAADLELLEEFAQAGIKFIGLVKSSLINGEHLIAKAKATLKNLYNLILNLQLTATECIL